jgi:carboxypeptidase family protein
MRVLFIFALACAAVFGQAVSQISGTVKDDSGALVPGVEVTVTQTDTGAKRSATTDETGSYILTNLPLGPYRLEASKTGFRSYVQTGIQLQVGGNPEIPVVLGVGQVSESVQVQAAASSVETRSAGVGTVIETQKILDLPLNGRQATDLITLSGLAVQTGASPAYNMSTGVHISVAGGMSYSIQYNLDGAPHLDTYDGTSMPLPFPDALQEFKLITSSQDASSGGHSAASVNAVTKSGSNALHGDLFEFIRNGDLNGRDFFATRDDQLKRNQFGGVLGGAIKKDKLFFFMGYQGTTTRQTPSAQTEFVPTPPMLNGDFRQYVAAGCTNGVSLRGPFVGNQVSPTALSSAAINIAKRLPQSSDPCGRVTTGAPLHEDRLQVPVRLDYQLSQKQSVFGRYIATRIDTKVPYTLAPNDVLTAGGTGVGQPNGIGTDDMAQSLTLGDTYLISSTTVNALRVSGNRVSTKNPGARYFSLQDVGINSYSYVPKWVTLSVQGAFGLGAGFSSNLYVYTTNFGVNDDVSMIDGAHQLSFGVNTMRTLLNALANAFSPGYFTVTAAVTGASLGDFLTGNVGQLRQASPNPDNLTQNFFGIYAQDTWKATPKTTLTYGLRWNPFFPMSFKQGDVYNFSLARFYAGNRSTVIPTAPPGFTYPGDPGFSGDSGINAHWGNLEPRVGIAWDPFGDGKTAIRAGAGIAYDFIRQDLHLNTSSAAPFRLAVIRLGINLDNPWAGFAGGNPFPYSFDPAHPVYPNVPFGTFLPVPPDMKTTKQYTWNFGIQRQFTSNFFASATYVGTELNHVWNAVELNPAQYIPGNCPAGQYGLTAPGPCSNGSNVNQRRLLYLANPATAGALGYLTQYDDGGTQNYHGLLLNTSWRLGQSLNLAANYTWSHCIGLPVITLLNPGANYVHQAFQNNGPVNRNLDVGNCGSAAQGGGVSAGALDRRHIVNLTLVYQTPKFAGRALRTVATGWTLSTIYTGRTGQPLTIFTGLDNAMSGFFGNTGTQRPNQVLASADAPNKGRSCAPAPCVAWFNPAAFAQPQTGTYGNVGANSVFGPGFWEWDEAVSRQFAIREGHSIEVRAEAFNVTNSVRFNNPNQALSNPSTFGKINSSAASLFNGATGGGPRTMQFALKYVF